MRVNALLHTREFNKIYLSNSRTVNARTLYLNHLHQFIQINIFWTRRSNYIVE